MKLQAKTVLSRVDREVTRDDPPAVSACTCRYALSGVIIVAPLGFEHAKVAMIEPVVCHTLPHKLAAWLLNGSRPALSSHCDQFHVQLLCGWGNAHVLKVLKALVNR